MIDSDDEKDMLEGLSIEDSIILLDMFGMKLASRSLTNDSPGYCFINERVDCWSLDLGSMNLEE